jgi:cytidine deaminase
MKRITQQFEYQLFDSEEELEEGVRLLLLHAKEMTNRAYAPYSEFYVGAAVLLEDGSIIGGANQENASFPLCICAEQTALSNCGANHTHTPILKMAVTVFSPKRNINKPVSPCGACRQIILEYENRQGRPIEIILQGAQGEIIVLDGVKQLLPLSFDGGDL